MMEGPWIVAQTKPQREAWAAENVQRQGFEYYLPRLAAPTTSKPSGKPRFLFPRYLFVCTDGRWHCLLGTFGIATVLMQGSKPAFMPNKEIDRIRRLERDDGLIQLPPRRFKAGDAVRINGGAFSGYHGIYEQDNDSSRVRVLLDYLGRKTRVLISDEYLEAVV